MKPIQSKTSEFKPGAIGFYVAAAFAWIWIIARAAVQSVTLDEADTYLAFVARPGVLHWYPAANNHLLNTMLIRLFTAIFGLHHFTLRAPALLGALIYVAAALVIVRILSEELSLRWTLLLCLVYNPFIMDYLVAARGYSLALAFLMCALAAVACGQKIAWRASTSMLQRVCLLCSVFAGLSFVSNFSFGIIDAVLVLITALWACSAAKSNDAGAWQYTRIVAASSLPALAIIFGIAGWTLLHWPKGQFVYGAASLPEMLGSVLKSSVYELNPNLVNPLWYPALVHVARAAFEALGLLFIWRIVLLVRQKHAPAAWHWTFALLVSAVLILTVAAHWLMHVSFDIRLPKDRTAIYIAPLVMLLAGAAAAAPVRSLAAVLYRKGTLMLLGALSIYFLLSLRLSYFKEWKFEADTQHAYWAISYYNHAYGVRGIVTPWMYSSSLEFYRRLSGHETLRPIARSEQYPPNRCLYVLDYRWDHDFAERQRLKIVYRGEFSDMVVAINPELEKSGVSACSDDQPQAGR